MSLKVIKAGILDTIQDTGRYGSQHLGINPGGSMDRFSSRLSNCLLGKLMDAPVIELHYPAPTFQFNEAAIILLAGADFSPTIDNRPIPLLQPVAVNKNATLEFKGVVSGARAYLSVLQNLHINKWLGSYGTNVKAQAGGFEGRQLKKGDLIFFEKNDAVSNYLTGRNSMILPWGVRKLEKNTGGHLEVIAGKEWNWLPLKSRQLFQKHTFTITHSADRMGYRLQGSNLPLKAPKQLVSSGVNFGSVQLLPKGQLIVLMADHQTTGGYPVIANIISAHLPQLAQMKPGDQIAFRITNTSEAEKKLLRQHQYLLSVQHASSFKIKQHFS